MIVKYAFNCIHIMICLVVLIATSNTSMAQARIKHQPQIAVGYTNISGEKIITLLLPIFHLDENGVEQFDYVLEKELNYFRSIHLSGIKNVLDGGIKNR